MANVIIIALLAAIAVYAVISSRRHFKGESGCCGGGGGDIAIKKKLEHEKLGEYVIHIEGMTCNNCRIRVENAVNKLDGVCAKVSLKKKQAVVSYDREVSKEEIIKAVRAAGYQVNE
ncbi:MAG: heavy-metal-associated domain-containing protein [Lachnospiraceae bacterium]|nr:heavy-metal-associated domain-containing protein [Lachnospiraceae bacterium]